MTESAFGKLGRKEFVHGEHVLVYDFDTMTMWQAKMAEAVYSFQADVERRPPSTFDELVSVGRHDYMTRTLSFLLRRQTEQGVVQTKTLEEAKAIQLVIEDMGARDIETFDEVVRDFFTRSGRYMLWLLVRQKHEFRVMLDASTYSSQPTQPTSSEPEASLTK